MWIIIGGYALIIICVIILAVITYMIWDKRYRKNHGARIPEGFIKTEEVNIDPNDGKRYRVYFNSKTGERFYHEENNNGYGGTK